MLLICAFAFLKGDEPERVGAATYILAWFASLLVQDDGELYNFQWGMAAIDLLVLAVFAGLAWKSRRAWPVWASALQLLAVTTHVMALIDVRPSISSFYTVLNLAAYGVIVTIGIGTFWAWQERRAAGLE